MKNLVIKICVFTFIFILSMSMAAFAQDPDVENGKRSFHPEIQAGPEYDFRKTTWGMSIDEVKASEEKKPDGTGSMGKEEGVFVDYLAYFDISLIGENSQLMYFFSKDKLIEADIHFFNDSEGERLVDKMTSIFGSPQYDNLTEDGTAHFYGWQLGNTKLVLSTYLVKKQKNTPNATLTILDASQLEW